MTSLNTFVIVGINTYNNLRKSGKNLIAVAKLYNRIFYCKGGTGIFIYIFFQLWLEIFCKLLKSRYVNMITWNNNKKIDITKKRYELGINKDDFVILFVGRIAKEKNIELLLPFPFSYKLPK